MDANNQYEGEEGSVMEDQNTQAGHHEEHTQHGLWEETSLELTPHWEEAQLLERSPQHCSPPHNHREGSWDLKDSFLPHL